MESHTSSVTSGNEPEAPPPGGIRRAVALIERYWFVVIPASFAAIVGLYLAQVGMLDVVTSAGPPRSMNSRELATSMGLHVLAAAAFVLFLVASWHALGISSEALLRAVLRLGSLWYLSIPAAVCLLGWHGFGAPAMRDMCRAASVEGGVDQARAISVLTIYMLFGLGGGLLFAMALIGTVANAHGALLRRRNVG